MQMDGMELGKLFLAAFFSREHVRAMVLAVVCDVVCAMVSAMMDGTELGNLLLAPS